MPDLLSTDAELTQLLHEVAMAMGADLGTVVLWRVLAVELFRLRRAAVPAPLVEGGYHA
jgi:hypothetical protein